MALYSRQGGISVVENPSEIIVSEAGAIPAPSRTYVEPLRTYIRDSASYVEPLSTTTYSTLPTTTYVEPITTTTYVEPVVVQPSVVVRKYEEPSVVRTVAEPVITYVGHPTTIYNEAIVGEPVYRSPVREVVRAPVTYLDSVPEGNEADWVVVEKAPRSAVRHPIVEQIGSIRTPDGRYIIGEASVGKVKETSLALSNYAEGILRTPDGRIKYADGTLQPATPARVGLQGSIVALSDGSILLPDGTIEYPDGTVRKPTNATYSGGVEYSERAWSESRKNNQGNLHSVNEQIAQLKDQMKAEIESIKSEKEAETSQLKQKLSELESERKIFEKELTIIKEGGPGGWAGAVETLRTELRELQGGSSSPVYRETLQAKEDHLKMLHEQFLVEAKANAEARGLLLALQEERARETETRQLVINEAVLRKEQEIMREKDRIVADMLQKSASEREALLAQERAQAERMMENEISTERARLQAELQQFQELAEAERKRAEDEHLLATVERERALAAEEQLAALQLGSPEKKKKKKKKKGKKSKGKKGKAKPKGAAIGVIGKPRLVSKAPARR